MWHFSMSDAFVRVSVHTVAIFHLQNAKYLQTFSESEIKMEKYTRGSAVQICSQVNHIWMKPFLLFAHLCFLFVLQFAHSVRVKGKTHQPSTLHFLCAVQIINSTTAWCHDYEEL